MNHIDEKEIIERIRLYLEEKIYNYAILLDGDWGCGKTYFVKEILIPELKKTNEKNAVYVSLYGIKSVDGIVEGILMSILEAEIIKQRQKINEKMHIMFLRKPKLLNSPNLIPNLNNVASIMYENIPKRFLSDTTIEKSMQLFSCDKYYFVFDDLERCSMPINEVLGYINSFVEQKNAKVLIIANEDEIGTVESSENDSIMYLVAIQNSIKWPVEANGAQGLFENYHTINHSRSEKLEIDELNRRIKLLTEENALYLQIKEKLIGQTLVYRPTLRDIIPVIYQKCINDKALDPITKNNHICTICQIMESKDYYNLRTLQFALIFWSKVIATFPDENRCIECYQKLISRVLEAALRVSIACKRGEATYQWADNSEHGVINFEDTSNIDDYFFSFRFVHEYVYSGKYDVMKIKSVLEMYHIDLVAEKKTNTDASNKLMYFWEMEDEEIEECLSVLYKNLKNRVYEARSYRWILSLLFRLKGLGFEAIPIEKFFHIMEEDVAAGKSIDTMQEPIISSDDQYINDYLSCLDRLKGIEQKSSQAKKESSLNSIFDIDKNWGKAFSDYYSENRAVFLSERGLFKHIDIEKCYNAIDRASVKDVSNFRRTIASAYHFSNVSEYFLDDVVNIDRLHKLLSENCGSKMKQYNITLLRQTLESILCCLKK